MSQVVDWLLSTDPQLVEAAQAIQQLVKHRTALLRVVEVVAKQSVRKRIDRQALKIAVNEYSAQYGWPDASKWPSR